MAQYGDVAVGYTYTWCINVDLWFNTGMCIVQWLNRKIWWLNMETWRTGGSVRRCGGSLRRCDGSIFSACVTALCNLENIYCVPGTECFIQSQIRKNMRHGIFSKYPPRRSRKSTVLRLIILPVPPSLYLQEIERQTGKIGLKPNFDHKISWICRFRLKSFMHSWAQRKLSPLSPLNPLNPLNILLSLNINYFL